MLNVQLDRIVGMVGAMRRERKRILAGVTPLANLGIKAAPLNSADHDCSTQVILTLPSAESAARFVSVFPSVIAGKTGRYNYTEWDGVLMGFGAAHPKMNPFECPADAERRKTHSKDMCARWLEILNCLSGGRSLNVEVAVAVRVRGDVFVPQDVGCFVTVFPRLSLSVETEVCASPPGSKQSGRG